MHLEESDFYPLHDFAYKSGDAYLFPYEDRWYVLYEGTGPGMKREVLIFDSDEYGRVRNWSSVTVEGSSRREQALDELERKRGKTPPLGARPIPETES
jgi:hypothetical protein